MKMTEIKLFLFFFGLLFSIGFGVPYEENRRVAELEAQVKAITSRLDDMAGKFDALMALTQKSDRQALASSNISRETERGDNSTRRFSRAAVELTYFTAKLENKVENLRLYTPIVFDVPVSYSDGYDRLTGVFTCPQTGLYLFSIFVESANEHEAKIGLKKDGALFASAISQPSTRGKDDSGGNVVILYVEAGHRVWVEPIHFDNQSLLPEMTTFSGVLIHAHSYN